MAFMNQDKKAAIAAELKKVMPKDWKYSLSVQHHSSITLTITAAPVDLMDALKTKSQWTTGYAQLNEYHLDGQFEGELLVTFEAIRSAMNTGNFDHSDSQSDYFCVGHYAYIHIGRWNKPFVVLPPTVAMIAKQEREEESKRFIAAPWKETKAPALTEGQLMAEVVRLDPFQTAPHHNINHVWLLPKAAC